MKMKGTAWEYIRLVGVLAATALLGLPVGGTARAHADDQMFMRMDTNGDGKISPAEHATAAKNMFDVMDANHDGKVTAAEMTAAHDKVVGAKAEPAKADKAARSAKESGHELSAAEKIKAVDADGDGVLTAAEHAAGSQRMFDTMDTDHDRALSKNELREGHARMLHRPAK